jgi:hypothetical protein
VRVLKARELDDDGKHRSPLSFYDVASATDGQIPSVSKTTCRYLSSLSGSVTSNMSRKKYAGIPLSLGSGQ